MSHILNAIMREAPSEYRVLIECEHTGAISSFLFRIPEAEIEAVHYEDDFAQYFSRNLGPARVLFEAIVAFHHAQRMSLPP
jgi:hypothetical protein